MRQAKPLCQISPKRSEQALYAEVGAVDKTPGDERPCRAVPEAAEKHDQHEIEVGPGRALSGAAEGDVDVVTKPAGKRDVPTPPELTEAG